MLSYQHIYHAGSIADVHKHAILLEILNNITQDKTQICYYETHAGRGLYDLASKEANKTMEYLKGIQNILDKNIFPANSIYLKLIADIRKKYGNSFYPGSPLIAQNILRKNDEIYLMELHPGEIVHLKNNIKNVSIQQMDGYDGVLELIPPQHKKGVILIDPSYEVKTEYQLVADFVDEVLYRWEEAVIMLWYPVLGAGNHKKMLENIIQEKYKNCYAQELHYPRDKDFRMHGTGVFVINCPEAIKNSLDEIGEKFKTFIGHL